MAQDQTGNPSEAPAGGTIESITIDSSEGVELRGELSRASSAERGQSVAVLFLHGFPSGDVWGDKIGSDLSELCQRVTTNANWNAATFRFRGCGESTGDFSLAGWVDDASAAIRFLHKTVEPKAIWVCGFGTGGAVGLVAAAENPVVTGVVTAGSPADFDDWAASPEGLLNHAREVGAIRSSDFPPNVARWGAELREVRAVEAAEKFSPRPLLILHGSADDAVPHFDARALADAHRSADLRFINGAGHNLRLDPRATAILLGWLDRQALARLDG